jgi:hypothetical protein
VTALQGTKVIPVPIIEGVKESKTVDKVTYEIAKVFFG